MYPTQSNTRPGVLPAVAGEDLSTAEGLLALLANDNGSAVAKLPATATDLPPFVCVDGGAIGEQVALKPLSPESNCRVQLKGACAPGERLVMADPATAEDIGKVIALPADAGDYISIGKAEETGVDGQLILLRPFQVGTTLTVSA